MGALADQKSRHIYIRQIKYRCTYDRKFSKPYNMWNQYFPHDIIKLKDNEVFVDCGAYVGDTAKRFIKKVKGKYKRIVCFEPDIYNCKKLSKLANVHQNIVIYQKGTYSTNKKIYFDGGGFSSSRISEMDGNGDEEIEVIALDDITECQDMTFLKMDIEGAEWETLKGAAQIIKRRRPVLAICIYHSDEDMLRIPQMIKEEYPDYKLYIRQHFFLPLETVLYAIPSGR